MEWRDDYSKYNDLDLVASVIPWTDEDDNSLYKGDYNIPKYIIVKGIHIPVIGIEDEAFYGAVDIKSVTLGDEIFYIEDSAFSHSGVTSITLPSSLVSIGSYCFEGCNNLKILNIPENVKCDSKKDLLSNGFRELWYNHLTTLTVSEDNPYIYSWNNGIYTREDNILIASAGGSDSFTIKEDCYAVARNAIDSDNIQTLNILGTPIIPSYTIVLNNLKVLNLLYKGDEIWKMGRIITFDEYDEDDEYSGIELINSVIPNPPVFCDIWWDSYLQDFEYYNSFMISVSEDATLKVPSEYLYKYLYSEQWNSSFKSLREYFPETMYLCGSMNNWKTRDSAYTLNKVIYDNPNDPNEPGIIKYAGIFKFNPGTEFLISTELNEEEFSIGCAKDTNNLVLDMPRDGEGISIDGGTFWANVIDTELGTKNICISNDWNINNGNVVIEYYPESQSIEISCNYRDVENGVNDIFDDLGDNEVKYFNLQGVPVEIFDSSKGLVIKVTKNGVEKVIL